MISNLAFASILLSALLHAVWNAIARASPQPGDVLATAVMASGLLMVPVMAVVGLPDRQAWGWIAFGIIVNSIGIRLAMAAYRRAPYALAYPVMRAGIPLIALPVAILFFGEWPTLRSAAGVLLIATALVMLALIARRSGRAELAGVGLALLASGFGAAYVTADAMAVRLSNNVLGFASCISIGNGLVLAAMLAVERRNPIRVFASMPRLAFGVSLISNASFLLYIWAVAVTPVALAVALRETSVFFAMAIAAFVMREQVGPLHWAAAALAVAGVISIRLA